MCAERLGHEELAEIRRITDEKRASGDRDAWPDYLALNFDRVLTTALFHAREDERKDKDRLVRTGGETSAMIEMRCGHTMSVDLICKSCRASAPSPEQPPVTER
jgi:hypothetical protein